MVRCLHHAGVAHRASGDPAGRGRWSGRRRHRRGPCCLPRRRGRGLGGRPRDHRRLQPALAATGCQLRTRTVYLALVGSLTAASGPPDLVLEEVTPTMLPGWVATQHRGFAGSDDPPPAEALAAEVERRRVELDDVGPMWLARLEGEPVAGLAFYDGDDRLVNSPATRVPFRGRGIAQALLRGFVDDSRARGCRSALINADADDWPVQLYRRLGFIDEVLPRPLHPDPLRTLSRCRGGTADGASDAADRPAARRPACRARRRAPTRAGSSGRGTAHTGGRATAAR